MPGPPPSWLTAWIKINNRHVTYSDSTKRASKEAPVSIVQASGAASPRSTPDLLPNDSSHHSHDSSHREDSKQLHLQQDPSFSVASGLTNFDPDPATRSLPGDTRLHRLPQSLLQRRPNNQVPHDSPLAADLQGSGLFAGASSDASNASYPRLTGKYLNEAAFVQQLEQRQRAESRQRGELHGSGISPPPPPPPTLPPPEVTLKTSRMTRSNAIPSSSSVKSDSSPATSHPFSGGLKFFPPSFFGDQQPPDKPCSNCKSLEQTLDAAFDDIEYLRSLAVQKVYTCGSCGKPRNPATSDAADNYDLQPSANTGTSSLWPPSPSRKSTSSLGDYTKQIREATSRHRKQVEQLTKERVRWQQDIHFKLVKFANLCKDLNEESVVRNERALSLEHELRQVKVERDEQAEEASRLRARVQELERYEAECLAMKHRLYEYEQQGMRHAEAAIESRDQTIQGLTTKLNLALDQLEIERAQRQRRQIIFPVNGTTNGHQNASNHSLL